MTSNSSLRRILATAGFELSLAIRSRRALVSTLLFAAVGALVMYLTVSAFVWMGNEVVRVLQLPSSDDPAAAIATLWRSEHFQRAIRHFVGDNLVFAELMGRNPLGIAFAGIVFWVVAPLTLLTVSPTAAGELRSGAARYVLLRVSRNEWVLGVFLAELAMLLVAIGFLAVTADVVVGCRLGFASAAGLLPSLIGWALRAWVYAVPWTGLCLGLSMMFRTPGRAVAVSIVAALALAAVNMLASGEFAFIAWFCPQNVRWLLWRNSFASFFTSVVSLTSLAFLYLGLGAFVFGRRDV